MRLALDQNFPLPLVTAFAQFIPPKIALEHLTQIDTKLSTVDDNALVLELHRRGYDGLVTTDYHMLDDPETVAALVHTKVTLIAIEAAGHDPLKATAAVFQELPGLEHRLRPNEPNVIVHRPRPTAPKSAWEHLQKIAEKQGVEAADLWTRYQPPSA